MESETKMGKFKTGTKKFFGRTNERLKQKMSRSSDVGTKDEKWAINVANFNRQQAAAQKLHREVKGYIASLKTMENSTQTLLEAVREMHEYTWPGNMNMVKALQGLDRLTREYNTTMIDTMLVPINNYVEVFPEVKERMSKRDRKLLDFTRCKRNLDHLKKGDKISENKLAVAQEEYSENKIIFDELNNELCEDLPEFFNSRIPFVSKFLDGFFTTSRDFHKEFSQVYTEAEIALEPLKESLRKAPEPKRDIGDVDKFFVVTDGARKFKRQSIRRSFKKSGGFRRSFSMGALGRKSKGGNKNNADSVPASMSNLTVDPYNIPAQQATTYTPHATPAKKASPPRPKPPRSPRNENTIDSDIGDGNLTPFSPSVALEIGTIVECVHEYKAVDDDELSFVDGNLITVVPWDSTDEQDEGWYMGVLQETGAKGAFPINYTRSHKQREESDPLNITTPKEDTPAETEEKFDSIDLDDKSLGSIEEEELVEPPKDEAEYTNLPRVEITAEDAGGAREKKNYNGQDSEHTANHDNDSPKNSETLPQPNIVGSKTTEVDLNDNNDVSISVNNDNDTT